MCVDPKRLPIGILYKGWRQFKCNGQVQVVPIVVECRNTPRIRNLGLSRRSLYEGGSGGKRSVQSLRVPSFREVFQMKRAPLVIDVQREYFEGAFPIRHPVGHLANILELMDVAKKANVPTVVIRHHQPDPESPVFRKGSDMWQLHDEVQSRPRDVLIDKQLPGSFTNTSLEHFLKERNVDTVCIAGYMTQVCATPRHGRHFTADTKLSFFGTQRGRSMSRTKLVPLPQNNYTSRFWLLSRCSSAM